MHAHVHRHNFHVEKFAVDKQILFRERWLPVDVGDVTSKDTLIGLKLLHTSLLINFTTEPAMHGTQSFPSNPVDPGSH